MNKVTRIVYGKDLNAAKFNQLVEIADRLGKLRTEIWRRFGSINGIGVSHRIIRDQWLAEQREFEVPARLWKETLRDTLGDINAYCESAKEKVRRAIRKRTNDDKEIRRLRGEKTQTEIASLFGVSVKAIKDIFYNKTWKWVV